MNQPSYPNFEVMLMKKFRKYAKDRGVVGYSGLDKDSLISNTSPVTINPPASLDGVPVINRN